MPTVIRGIASVLGERVPLSRLTHEGCARAELLQLAARGVLGFHRATQTVLELAVAAGRASLERAGMAAGSIDVLVFSTNSGRAPEFAGDIAHELLTRLGLTRAYVHGVGFQNCGDGVLALRTAQALIVAGHATRALIVFADKVCDAGVPRAMNHAYLHSDGAAGCVADAGGAGFAIGASLVRHAPEGAAGAGAHPHDLEANLSRFIGLARGWMQEQRVPLAATDHLVTHNINRLFDHRLAEGFDLDGARVITRFEQGHCLAADVLMNLETLQDRASPGDRVWLFAPTRRSYGVMALQLAAGASG